MHYERHALEVVTRFKKMLDADLIEQIGDVHFQEMETLIAAALGVVDSQARHEIAAKLDSVVTEIKKDAGQVDSDYLTDLKDSGE